MVETLKNNCITLNLGMIFVKQTQVSSI